MNPGIEFIFAIEAAMLLSLNFQCYGKTENCLYKSVALQNSISGQPVPFPFFLNFCSLNIAVFSIFGLNIKFLQ